MKYDVELRIFSKEDRRTVAAILSDNGYDVGQHKAKNSKNSRSLTYYIHATDIKQEKSQNENSADFINT